MKRPIELTIEQELPDQPAIRELLSARDVEMDALYVEGMNPCYVLSVEAMTKPNVIFLVARNGAEPVGTGALYMAADGWAEMKSVYVHPPARGHGIAEKIIERLETETLEQGFPAIRLETGIHQREAIRLYEKRGYERIPAFADYAEHPVSLFMEKRLS
jgi:putative acetyltransferase